MPICDAATEDAELRTAGVYEPLWNDAREQVFNPYRNVGRNDPCPCGSGKKFKKCCLNTDRNAPFRGEAA